MDSRAEKLITSTLRYEGGYVLDPADNGGETYRGISRKFHPSWSGWTIVDQNKPLKTNQIISSTSLENMVKDFYYKNFYLKMSIQNINNIVLAAHTFDHGVNAGIKNGIKVLQKAINTVTKANIAVDGVIGQQTLSLANGSQADEIAKAISSQRKTYYKNLVASKPSYQKFLNGWLKRVDKVDSEYGSSLSTIITSVIVSGDNSSSKPTENQTNTNNEKPTIINGTMITKVTGFFEALANFFNSLIGLRKN